MPAQGRGDIRDIEALYFRTGTLISCVYETKTLGDRHLRAGPFSTRGLDRTLVTSCLQDPRGLINVVLSRHFIPSTRGPPAFGCCANQRSADTPILSSLNRRAVRKSYLRAVLGYPTQGVIEEPSGGPPPYRLPMAVVGGWETLEDGYRILARTVGPFPAPECDLRTGARTRSGLHLNMEGSLVGDSSIAPARVRRTSFLHSSAVFPFILASLTIPTRRTAKAFIPLTPSVRSRRNPQGSSPGTAGLTVRAVESL